jgi:hypothetical protein
LACTDAIAHRREYFIRDADLPVIGASAEALGSIKVPTCVIPGNDWTHPRRVGENASQLLPNSELYILMPQDAIVKFMADSSKYAARWHPCPGGRRKGEALSPWRDYQSRWATSATSRNLASCVAASMGLPCHTEANPHWVESANWSRGK